MKPHTPTRRRDWRDARRAMRRMGASLAIHCGLFAGATATGCDSPHLALPRSGAEAVAELPLDLIWELELSTKASCGLLGGCPGPYSPQQATARCLPAERCRAETVKRPDHPRLLLSVVGATPGPATVLIRYQQPGSSTWLESALHVQFKAEQRTTPLTLGGAVPSGIARLDYIPAALTERGFSRPARCEPVNEYRDRFVCFSPEVIAGLHRYPSCEYTRRCEATRPPHGGFFARVYRDDHSIQALAFTAYVPYQGEITATWSGAEER